MIETVALGDVTDVFSGFAFNSKHFSDEGELPIVRIRDVVRGRSETFYVGEYAEKFVVSDGDVLIGMDGEFNRERWRGGRALLNQRVCRIRPSNGALNQDYLYHFLPLALKSIERVTPFVTVKHLLAKQIRAIEIPLPPIGEQRRIAAVLDTADALRTKRREALAKLDTLTQAIFIDMFGDPVANLREWPMGELSELGDLDRGVSRHRPRNDSALLDGEWPFIQTGDVAGSGGYITDFTSTYSDLGLAQSKLWPRGTLCITIAANIAKTGILDFEACFPDSIVGFTAKDAGTVEFVRSFLEFLQPALERQAPESAQKNINLKVLRSLKTPVPPADLRARFADRVIALKDTRAVLYYHKGQLDTLFASLQQRAFRGEL